ncbi:hypothetical protein [Erwinia sp. HR93]|nr:hypothetical protein [Erwinia sp. HR93]MEA1063323.1 hypothetical protein [Erwinia sp. HR93]
MNKASANALTPGRVGTICASGKTNAAILLMPGAPPVLRHGPESIFTQSR